MRLDKISFIVKYKHILIIIVGVIIFTLFIGDSPKSVSKDFLEAMYSGNAKKCVSLMSDDLISKIQKENGLDTKKLVIKTMQGNLDKEIENFKDKYGKKWKYDIEIVDCYEKDGITKVAFEVHFKGKGLFKQKEGKEKGNLTIVKSGIKWQIDKFGN